MKTVKTLVMAVAVAVSAMVSSVALAQAYKPSIQNVVLTYDRVVPSFGSSFSLADGFDLKNLTMDEKTCQTVRVWDDGTVFCMKNGEAQEVGVVGERVLVRGPLWAFRVKWNSKVEVASEIVPGLGEVYFIRVK